MGLFDDLTDENKLYGSNVVRCTVCKVLNQLPTAEADQLRLVLQNPQIPKANVARILTSNGFDITPNTLTRHVRGECSGTRR